MVKMRIPSVLINPFAPMCALRAQKRVQGRSPWRVPRGEPGAEREIEIDRGDTWLSNKTKFSLNRPLNRAKNKFLVGRFFFKKKLKNRPHMGINGLIRYQNFQNWSKMEQKCKN